MPGITGTFSSSPDSNIAQSLSNTESVSQAKTIFLFKNRSAFLNLTAYDGYPYSIFRTENHTILLEGMVYNRSNEDIEIKLKEISKQLNSIGDTKKLVKSFVESTDGDYLVVIWDKEIQQILIFNDYWGRLPLYYFQQKGVIGISREIKNLLEVIPSISFDRISLVEFIYFEFPLGDKTLFDGIKCLEPSSMLSISQESNNLRLVANRTSNQVFDRVNPYTNRTEGITNLKELFLDSVKSRIKVCDIESYKIASDLSGGFDSRIVLGGLEKFNHDVTYCTQKLNTNDQRQISQTLFEALDSPGDFLSPSPEHDYDLKKIGEFIYDYDCLGNFSVGYNSMIVASTLKNHVDTKTVRFMGFGGEFLRHPLKEFRKSLFYGIAHDFYFYSNISLEEACLLAGFDYESYCQQLSNYFQSYPEKTHEGQLTRLYFEYYFRYVISAEDYCRKFQWTVSPLWGNMFMQAVLYRVPLTWTGFRFFTHLMKAINPRLLFTPIYGKRVNLNSEWSLALFEMKERLKVMIRMHTPIARNIYKKIQTRLIEPQSWHIIKSEIYDIKSSLIKRILPERPQILGEKNVIIARRYLTLLMYLREIEARYNGKINGPHENLS